MRQRAAQLRKQAVHRRTVECIVQSQTHIYDAPGFQDTLHSRHCAVWSGERDAAAAVDASQRYQTGQTLLLQQFARSALADADRGHAPVTTDGALQRTAMMDDAD